MNDQNANRIPHVAESYKRVGTICLSKRVANTVKPVCNDHRYNEIHYLWFIQ